jgi:hypothetical protein
MSESVAIVGSRGYPDQAEVFSYVLGLAADDVVVSGGALGVGMTAEGAARARGLTVISYRPVKRHDRWQIIKATYVGSGHGPLAVLRAETFPSFGAAAYFRNGLIVNDADRVVAFWDGWSLGTRNARELAKKAGKPLETRRPMAGKP